MFKFEIPEGIKNISGKYRRKKREAKRTAEIDAYIEDLYQFAKPHAVKLLSGESGDDFIRVNVDDWCLIRRCRDGFGTGYLLKKGREAVLEVIAENYPEYDITPITDRTPKEKVFGLWEPPQRGDFDVTLFKKR